MGNKQYKTVKYNDIKNKILPLDLIFNDVKGIDIINIVQYICNQNHNGEWTHVGVILDSGSYNCIMDSSINGVGYNILDTYINQKNCTFAYCRLKNNPFIKMDNEIDYLDRIKKLRLIISDFYSKYINKPYEGLLHLTESIIPLSSHNSDDAVFCSELVVRLYQEFGLIDNKINPERILPGELFEYIICDEPIVIIIY